MSMKRLFLGLAAGAGAMYLLDPANGKERRQRLRERLSDAKSRLEHRLDGDADDAEGVVQGEYLDTYSRARKRSNADTLDRGRVEAAEGSGIISSASE